jgi:putative transposase
MHGLLRQGEQVKFAVVDAKKADYPVAALCRALDVSRAGFYAWRARPESSRAVEDRRLRVLIREAHERSRRTYGSPRVHAELTDNGVRTSRKRVVRLMQAEQLVARKRRRFKCTTMSDHGLPVAPNLLNRDFEAEAPNQRWVGDTTELYIGQARVKLYLAAILDLYSRFVVGWAVSTSNDRHLCIKALDMALRRRCPDSGLLHHSDRGSTYASEDYQRELAKHGITCSMSRRGNCYDNAVMESWFSSLKSELGENFDSYGIAKQQLFDYIEVFYNQQRRHSSLDYASPAQYERRRADFVPTAFQTATGTRIRAIPDGQRETVAHRNAPSLDTGSRRY